ncbi:hypothetical protein AYO44_05775 [Planctomycetaceae bacterium SCGC AG-212-F19]|nr:hypothetical protein AYO44_05775 [Planctomycetaceae bacterium SCGC AG-212-F19]
MSANFSWWRAGRRLWNSSVGDWLQTGFGAARSAPVRRGKGRRSFRPCLEMLEDRALPSASWRDYAHDPQHTGVADVASQPLEQIHWQTPVDLNPQFSGSDLLIHYGSPLVTANNTVIVPVKTGAADGFEIEGINAATGALKWTVTSDYILPPHNWTPSYSPALAPDGRLYFAGVGGTIYYIDNPDANGATVSGHIAFYGIGNYNSSLDGTVFINTPLTVDSAGNLYFGFEVTGGNSLGLQSGIARIGADGTGTWIAASTAAGDGNIVKVVHNCAPALSNDGSSLYVAVSTGSFGAGYLVELNSTTLAPMARVLLREPLAGNAALLPDDGSASPTVGPDGDVYFGVLENPFNSSKGWLLHFSGDLSQTKTPGAFGWDDTASIVAASLVPSYHGSSAYLLMTKYNNYAGLGGDGINKIAILDPNATQTDPRTGATVMQEVITIAGQTPDPDFPGNPGAVREWCINTAAVDPFTDSVVANSEDGKLYRWDLATNTFSQVITLTTATGEAYTPTLIGPDGTVYAINRATLFAVGRAPSGPVTITGTGLFHAPAIYPAGNTPDSIAQGDFNGDGKPDLVVTNFFGGNVSVLINQGNGTFAAPVHYATGSGPNGFVVADFNHDGKADIAVGNYYDNAVSVLLGNGDGTFQAAVNYAVGSGPANEMAFGDFNGDGNLDLATANQNDGTVSVLLGNGNGTFQPAVTYAAGPGSDGIVAADLNGDGKLDLAVANYSGNNISVLLNQGNGTFAAPVTYNVGANPWYIEKGDFNHDGTIDLITADSGGGTVSVLRGNGDGSFAAAVQYTVGGFPDGIAVADLNGDGNLDLAVSNYSTNDASVLFGNADGTFQAARSVDAGAGSGPNGITAADFNGDGKIDIASADQNAGASVMLSGIVSAVEGQSFTGVVASFTTSESNPSASEYSASINWGDGNTSAGTIAADGQGGFNVAGTHTYAEEGSYSLSIVINGPGGASATVANVAGVADPAVVVSGTSFTATEGQAFSNQLVATFTDPGGAESFAVSLGDPGFETPNVGTGFFGAFQYDPTGAPWAYAGGAGVAGNQSGFTSGNPNAPQGTQVGFLQGPGGTISQTFTTGGGNYAVSFQAAQRGNYQPAGNQTIDVLIDGNVVGTFTPWGTNYQSFTTAPIALSGGTHTLTFEGLNSGDTTAFIDTVSIGGSGGGGPYTAAINWGDGSTSAADSIQYNATTGIFSVYGGHTYASAAGSPLPVSVTIRHENAPAATATSTATIQDVPLTPIDGPFTSPALYGAGSMPDSIATIRLDNGQVALLVANFGSANVTVLLPNGDGTFHSGGNLAVSNGPNGFAVGDFNHDGHLDFAVGNYYDSTVTVYLGNGDGSFRSPAAYAVGANPANTMAVGDFNGDGNLDLATANQGNGTVTVLLGNSDGTFGSAVSYAGGSGNDSVVAVDVNGDGKLDLATANYNDGTASVLINQGNGTFAAPAIISVGSNPWYIDAGDFNKDGRMDLVVANLTGNSVSVLLNQGNGTFSRTDYGVGSWPTAVVVADMNRDGNPDLVVGNYGSTTVSVLLGNGDGTFQAALNFAAGGSGPNGVAVGDFNGDGKPDVAVADQDSGSASVLLNANLVSAVRNESFTGAVGSFTDANPLAPPTDFTATIHWGDGTTSTISASAFVRNAAGAFDVIGTHTYTQMGLFDITIVIQDVGGATTTVSNLVSVH